MKKPLSDAINRALDAEAIMRRVAAVLPRDPNEWAGIPNINEFLASQADELRRVLDGWPHWVNRSSLPFATAEMVALGTSISGYPLQTTYEAAKTVLHALESDDATRPIWRRIAALMAIIPVGDSQVETAQTYAPLRAQLERIRDIVGQESETIRHSKGGERKPAKQATVDERMAAELLRNQDCIGWTRKYWAQKYDCSESTVQDANTWKRIQVMRDAEKLRRSDQPK